MTGQKGRADSTCHPGKPMKAHGLCKKCYKVKWRTDNPERYLEEKRSAARRYRRRNPLQKRDDHLRRKYGLSLSDKEAILAAQDGICAICRTARTKMCVDHCHTTGKVRAVLCSSCNTGIGLFQENTTYMYHAIRYLEAHGATVDSVGTFR